MRCICWCPHLNKNKLRIEKSVNSGLLGHTNMPPLNVSCQKKRDISSKGGFVMTHVHYAHRSPPLEGCSTALQPDLGTWDNTVHNSALLPFQLFKQRESKWLFMTMSTTPLIYGWLLKYMRGNCLPENTSGKQSHMWKCRAWSIYSLSNKHSSLVWEPILFMFVIIIMYKTV